jgi:hypothetical protein
MSDLDTGFRPQIPLRSLARHVSALDVAELLHAITARGAGNLAIKVRVILSGVFQHALSLGLCESDPAFMARRAIARPKVTPHPAALTLPDARAVRGGTRLVAGKTCTSAVGVSWQYVAGKPLLHVRA